MAKHKKHPGSHAHRSGHHVPHEDHDPSSPSIPAKTESRRAPWWLHAGIVFVLAGVCVALYGRTLDYPMVFDDAVYLQNNPLVRDAANFGYLRDICEFVARPTKMGLEPDLATNFILRPVAYLTFHLNWLFDGYNPRWYHVVGIAFHTGTVLALYAALTALLSLGLRGHRLASGSVTFIAAAAALLFAVHPLATESVTYIVQRFTSMGAFFYLLTLGLYFSARHVQKKAAHWALVGAAVFTLVLGMLSKECCVTAPVMIVFLDWFVTGTSLRQALRKAVPLLVCLPIVPSLVLLTAWGHGNGSLSLDSAVNLTNSIERPMSHWDYLVTQFTAVAHYLCLMVWPAGQNIDPEWPTYSSLIAGPVVRSLLLFAGLLGLSWAWFRKHRQDARFAAVFAFTLFFFATISISSGLITLPDLMAEHRSYLPSVGIFAAFACLLDLWRTRRGGRWLVPACTLAAAIALGVATWQRNDVWSTKVALWKDTTEKSPGKYRVWNNLGEAYAKANQAAEAADCFKKSIEIGPLCWTAYVNLAGVLNGLAKYQESYNVSMTLLKGNPSAEKSVDVRYNVGLSCLGLGMVDKGTALLKELVALAPAHRPSKIVLGLVYSQTHQPRKALEQWQHAIALEPPDEGLVQLMRQEEEVLRRSDASILQVSSVRN